MFFRVCVCYLDSFMNLLFHSTVRVYVCFVPFSIRSALKSTSNFAYVSCIHIFVSFCIEAIATTHLVDSSVFCNDHTNNIKMPKSNIHNAKL